MVSEGDNRYTFEDCVEVGLSCGVVFRTGSTFAKAEVVTNCRDMAENGARRAASCKNQRYVDVSRCETEDSGSIDLWLFEGPPVVVELDWNAAPSVKSLKTISGYKRSK